MRAALAVGKAWLALVCVLVLGGNAVVAALYFWRMFPNDPAAQAFWVVVSVLASSVKILAPAIIAASGQAWRSNRALALAWCIAASFDLFSAYGYAQQSTGAVTGAAHELATARRGLTDSISELQKRVTELPATRHAAVVKASLDAAEAQHGKCGRAWEAKTDGCQFVFKLRSELASADARNTLLDEIVSAREKLAKLPGERDPDPQSTAIASAAEKMGYPISPETASRVRIIFTLILLELVPVSVLAYTLRPTPRPVRLDKPAPAKGTRGALVVATRPARAAGAQDVLALLAGAAEDADGWISLPPQRALGATLGISPAEANRQLQALVADGTIEKRAGRGGTRVRRKAMPQNVSPLRRTA